MVEVEIFEVNSHEFGGEDAVEEALGSGDFGRLSGDFARVVDAIASGGNADMTLLGFGLLG